MKADVANARYLLVSISYMVIVSRSCLCVRIFRLYGNQPHSAMAFLFDYTSENDFTQALLIMGIISLDSNSISPITC